jgi:hypothetical protein
VVSVAGLVERFPEFAALGSALVQSKLDQAERSIDADVWGDLADDGHAQLAAHLLAMTPEGGRANLRAGAGANQTSIYWQAYEDMRERVGGAYRVIVDDPGLVP